MLWQTLDKENEAQLSALQHMLSTVIFTSYVRSSFECALVHFTAVHGFDAERGPLRTAKVYAYMAVSSSKNADDYGNLVSVSSPGMLFDLL